jgi:dienelactone hydrolase
MIQHRAACACRGALAIALLLLAECSQSIAIPDQKIGASHVPDKALSADLVLPGGKGPFPAVILLHGCGGIGAGIWDWARRLQGWGYAAVVLDSFSARGATNVCSPATQHLVTPEDRVADVLSAALYLRSRPDIDGARIGVLGQSHGGRTAAMVTEQRYERLYPGLLKAVVDYYGGCGPPQAHGTIPLLALAGEADDWGHPALSCRALAAKLTSDQPFEIQTYPGVWHAFDNSETRPTMVAGHRLEYDSTAAADSYERVHAFFNKWLKD